MDVGGSKYDVYTRYVVQQILYNGFGELLAIVFVEREGWWFILSVSDITVMTAFCYTQVFCIDCKLWFLSGFVCACVRVYVCVCVGVSFLSFCLVHSNIYI